MIVRRSWSNDLYAFYNACEMDKLGITIVAVVFNPKTEQWDVWGQAPDTLMSKLDTLDERTDQRITERR